MSVGIAALDKQKIDEAFAQGTYRPFNDCWTVRMDKELLIVDDDEQKFSRFSDNSEEGNKALMVINEKNKQIVLFSIDNKLIASHPGGITDCALFASLWSCAQQTPKFMRIMELTAVTSAPTR